MGSTSQPVKPPSTKKGCKGFFSRRRRDWTIWGIPWLVFIVCIGITAVISTVIRQSSKSLAAEKFNAMAREHVIRVATSIQVPLEQLQLLSLSAQAIQSQGAGEFSKLSLLRLVRVAGPYLVKSSKGILRNLQHAPLIQDHNRAAFEAGMRERCVGLYCVVFCMK